MGRKGGLPTRRRMALARMGKLVILVSPAIRV
jgi:hypothetical protein